jgi:hypothetical protein
MPCSSIAALAQSAEDPNILVAGCGITSSGGGVTTELMGIMISKDGAHTWMMTNFPFGHSISSLVVWGSGTSISILAGIDNFQDIDGNTPPYSSYAGGGVMKSTNGGTSWTQINTSLMPIQRFICFSIVRDNGNGVLYIGGALMSNDGTSLVKVFVSSNNGDTWIDRSNIVNQCASTTDYSTAKILLSIHSNGATHKIYIGVFYPAPDCYSFAQSLNAGITWTNLPQPITEESDSSFTTTLGSQGSTHFAILGK